MVLAILIVLVYQDRLMQLFHKSEIAVDNN